MSLTQVRTALVDHLKGAAPGALVTFCQQGEKHLHFFSGNVIFCAPSRKSWSQRKSAK